MRSALRSVAVLVGLAVVGGAAVAWFADFTQARVLESRRMAETRLLRELAGVALDDVPAGDLALCERDLVILRGEGDGYGGAFRLALAVGAVRQGPPQVQGIRVIEHHETPGFGDILSADSAWLDSFRHGKVDAVTGATVTSQAVIAAVARTLRRLEREGLCRL